MLALYASRSATSTFSSERSVSPFLQWKIVLVILYIALFFKKPVKCWPVLSDSDIPTPIGLFEKGKILIPDHRWRFTVDSGSCRYAELLADFLYRTPVFRSPVDSNLFHTLPCAIIFHFSEWELFANVSPLFIACRIESFFKLYRYALNLSTFTGKFCQFLNRFIVER